MYLLNKKPWKLIVSSLLFCCSFNIAQANDALKRQQDNLLNLAKEANTIAAMQAFNKSYLEVEAANSLDISVLKQSLQKYAQDSFSKEYKDSTGTDADLSFIDKLSNTALILQYHYIANNSNAIGKKEALEKADDGSNWSNIHAQYHSVLHKYQEKHGFYDLFLVDIDTGNIVYSVFKELDFASNIKTGAFSTTELGASYQGGVALTAKNTTFVSKNASYFPSFEDKIQFVTTAIYDGDKKIGLLIGQLPGW